MSSFKLPFICFWSESRVEHQGSVVQKMDDATNRLNLSPVDDAIGVRDIYPLDSNLSGVSFIQRLSNLGQVKTSIMCLFLAVLKLRRLFICRCSVEVAHRSDPIWPTGHPTWDQQDLFVKNAIMILNKVSVCTLMWSRYQLMSFGNYTGDQSKIAARRCSFSMALLPVQ